MAAAHFEERVRREQQEAEAARHFKARGVPQAEPFAPQLSGGVLCSPKPFALQTELRGALSQAAFDAMLQEQENDLKAHAQFKARACTVTKAQPFQVHKSTKPLTELQVRRKGAACVAGRWKGWPLKARPWSSSAWATCRPCALAPC